MSVSHGLMRLKITGWLTWAVFVLLSGLWTGQVEAAVCVVVKIEIKQELTLERQGFVASMKINNALEDKTLDNVKITVNFKDQNGDPVVATSDTNSSAAKFYINIDAMKGIKDVNGTGVVQPASTAQISWLIIPAVGAGGTLPSGKLYFVGATLTYTLGGEPRTTVVSPDSIYVKPLPALSLDYFLTRQLIADDAFTPAIEPAEPFTLGIRVRNNGAAPARNVRIDSAQPTIVENKNDLLISFTIIGSHVNDVPGSNSLLVNLGTIEPGRATVARWDMLTTLSGKFTAFDATLSHADALGGQLTSIIKGKPTTYFLVHNVRVDEAGKDRIPDFLAYPATGSAQVLRVYESDNIDTPVLNQSASATFTPITSGNTATYRLSAPVTAGYMYIKLPDPYRGGKAIRQVVRSDGKYLLRDNAWTSKSRNLNNDPPTWNYWINFFDSNTTGQYIVTLAPPVLGPVPPKFTPMNNITTSEGRLVSFPVSALDPNGDVVTLSVSGIPLGAGFVDNGNGSGLFTWTPGQGQAGHYSVTFNAADTGGLTSSMTVLMTVSGITDSDGDGMDDAWEIRHFGNLSHDGKTDTDGDGVSDLQEYLNGTDPNFAAHGDVNGDGVVNMADVLLAQKAILGMQTLDAAAIARGDLYPAGGDGKLTLSDVFLIENAVMGTLPSITDSDGDLLPDAWEVMQGLDPHNAADARFDSDGDGLTNAQEYFYHTDPHVADTDGDGISDGAEVSVGTSPIDNRVYPVAMTSTPVRLGGVGEGYHYLLKANVPGADFELVKGPAGMRMTGNAISWTPSAAQRGEQTVTIKPRVAGFVSLEQTYTLRIYQADGDLNGDGVVDASDVLLLEQIAMGRRRASDEQAVRGDVYPVGQPDGQITFSDILVLQKRVLNGGAP